MKAFQLIYREEGLRAFWKGHVAAQYLSVVYGVVQVRNTHEVYPDFINDMPSHSLSLDLSRRSRTRGTVRIRPLRTRGSRWCTPSVAWRLDASRRSAPCRSTSSARDSWRRQNQWLVYHEYFPISTLFRWFYLFIFSDLFTDLQLCLPSVHAHSQKWRQQRLVSRSRPNSGPSQLLTPLLLQSLLFRLISEFSVQISPQSAAQFGFYSIFKLVWPTSKNKQQQNSSLMQGALLTSTRTVLLVMLLFIF